MAAPNPYRGMPTPGQQFPMFAPGASPYGYQARNVNPALAGGNVNPALQGMDPGIMPAESNPYTPQVNGGPPGYGPGAGPRPTAAGYPEGYDATNAPMWDPATQSLRGSAGGFPGMPGSPMPDSMAQYGYGDRAGQGGWGFEQKTPVGSFAAANTNTASNPYIGQTSQGVGGGWGANQNQYLDRSTQQANASNNPLFGMNNPYTTQAIDAASADITRNYNLAIAPHRDAQAARSGSFGNTGVDQMRQEDQRNLGTTIADTANRMRMQDLQAQQQMGEGAANRGTNVNLANSGFNAGDLNRQTSGSYVGQGMGLDASKFDAGLRSHDLDRNTAASGAMSMFNAGQGNAGNMFNAAAGNNMLNQYRQRTDQNYQFDQTMGQRRNEFDQGMDFNTWQANNANMRGGNQDTMNFMNMLMNWQGQGVNAENQQQQNPYQQWMQMISGAGTAGGMGGSNTTPYYGSPILGGLAGYNMFGYQP